MAFTTQAQPKKKKNVVVKNDTVITTKDFVSIDAFPYDMLPNDIKNATEFIDKAKVPENGFVYSVVSSINTNLNDCNSCGPEVGYETSCISKYIIETRKYSEYNEGQIIRVWMSTISIFIGCGSW